MLLLIRLGSSTAANKDAARDGFDSMVWGFLDRDVSTACGVDVVRSTDFKGTDFPLPSCDGEFDITAVGTGLPAGEYPTAP